MWWLKAGLEKNRLLEALLENYTKWLDWDQGTTKNQQELSWKYYIVSPVHLDWECFITFCGQHGVTRRFCKG